MMHEEMFNDLLNRLENRLRILFTENKVEYIELNPLKYQRPLYISQVLIKIKDKPITRIRKVNRCPQKAICLCLIDYNYFIEGISEDMKMHYLYLLNMRI